MRNLLDALLDEQAQINVRAHVSSWLQMGLIRRF
jgi:hypothetical protein